MTTHNATQVNGRDTIRYVYQEGTLFHPLIPSTSSRGLLIPKLAALTYRKTSDSIKGRSSYDRNFNEFRITSNMT